MAFVVMLQSNNQPYLKIAFSAQLGVHIEEKVYSRATGGSADI
jgi:hypothetical protein